MHLKMVLLTIWILDDKETVLAECTVYWVFQIFYKVCSLSGDEPMTTALFLLPDAIRAIGSIQTEPHRETNTIVTCFDGLAAVPWVVPWQQFNDLCGPSHKNVVEKKCCNESKTGERFKRSFYFIQKSFSHQNVSFATKIQNRSNSRTPKLLLIF